MPDILTPLEMAEIRAAFYGTLPTACAVWRSSGSGALAFHHNDVCRVRPFKAVSGKHAGGGEVYSPATYMNISVEDLRCLDFGYSASGVTPPDIKRTDQIRVTVGAYTHHYNVRDLVADGSYQPGLVAICQRSA